MSDLARVAQLIRDADTVALACHVVPDGDALGSLLAFHLLCAANGKRSVASWGEPFQAGPHYSFLPALDTCTKPQDFPDEPDLMITFDCGSLARLGELAEPARRARELVVLDHHASNERYGTVNVIDTDAASTTVVVRNLAAELGWEIDRDVAVCIYTGLVTDTGRFQYSCTTPAAFELAAELARFDIPIPQINRQLFEEHRFDELRLTGACLERAIIDRDLRFVATWVTRFDYDGFGVTIEETEGLIDLVRRAVEADVVCVAKEAPDGVRVSLRSLRDVDVAAIARRFGGGGHHYSAGFTAPYPTCDVIEAIKDELRVARGLARQRVW